jgi:hypothetical protein
VLDVMFDCDAGIGTACSQFQRRLFVLSIPSGTNGRGPNEIP